MSQFNFVHLRMHTEYSLVDGLIKIKPLMQALPKLHMNSIAITDFCNLFGVIKFYQAAVECGIKPIIGCDLLYFHKDKPQQFFSILLLCQNKTGYVNLSRLVSRAYQEGQIHGKPYVQFDWIKEASDGLIALSGGLSGEIGKIAIAGDLEEAKKQALLFSVEFPKRFYLEIQRLGRENEDNYNALMIQLAQDLNLPLVATNDVCFQCEEDYEAHEARVCINEGSILTNKNRAKKYSKEQYLRSNQEMIKLFADLPEAIENSVEISKRCNLQLELNKNYLPNFPTPNQESVEDYLETLAKLGLTKRLKLLFKDENLRAVQAPKYEERLQNEVNVINSMGFAGYFLIVADFILWAKNNGVPVGPGRGSGAGSLVAYALEITDLDPIQYDLLFERFLNPERISMPDFDIDFCMDGRDKVIDYVANKYGRNAVSQIITFGTMAAKAVVRDVGRVLGHPYGFVDKIAKLIPFELGMTLTKALEQEVLLKERYQEEEEVKDLIDLALKLEGITRNAGKHAGGVVIAPSELTDFTAIYCEEGSNQIVTQFDKDDVEAAGLVKFDFLGLRTLTIINWAINLINKDQDNLFSINDIPLDDEKTFSLLKSCQTTAVFQLESRGMKELIHRLQPDCFEDIIALVALFRPGPLQSGMVDDFIDRKHGRSQVQYPHPDLKPILQPTYGVILYQEQVMQIAQVLANYTLGAADILRRAMGKKKPEEMAKQREIFIKGATNRGVSEETATYIFDLMEKFAGYGFNKSHSAAYALLAYQTAWLKAHHKGAFMASVLSSDLDNTDKVVNLIYECKQMGLSISRPSINHSFYEFIPHDNDTILYGLGAIKGVGKSAITGIIEERARAKYNNLFDFCQRQDLRKVNRRVLEALVKSGAMDEFGKNRASLLASIDKALALSTQSLQNAANGQTNLFDLFAEDIDETFEYIEAKDWDNQTRLTAEKETLGFYLSGHPARPYLKEFQNLVVPMVNLDKLVGKKAYVLGSIKNIRKILTKRGTKLGIINLEDPTGNLDAIVFLENFADKIPYIQNGTILILQGEIGSDAFSGGLKIKVNEIILLEEARIRFAKRLIIRLNDPTIDIFNPLRMILESNPGSCAVDIDYLNKRAGVKINLGEKWRIKPTDDLISSLTLLLKAEDIDLCY